MRKMIFAAAIAAAACGGSHANPTAPASTPSPSHEPVVPPQPTDPAPAPMPVGHPSSDLIPRAVFFGNPERANPQLSPDGKYLAWLAAKDGVLNVWVAPAAALDKARAVTADTARPITEYFWSFDKKHLLYLQDQAGDENFHLFRVDVGVPDAKAVDLTPFDKTRAEVLGLSERKPGAIVVGMNDRDAKLHDVYEVDLASGKRTELFENKAGYEGFVVDRDLHVRLGAMPSPDGGNRFEELAPPKGATAFSLVIGGDDALTTNVLGFDGTGKTLLVTDSRERDTGALFAFDLRSGKKTLLAEDARVDLGDVLVHPTDGTAQAVKVDYDTPTWKVIDKRVKPDLDAIAKVAGADFDVASRTLDDRTWMIVAHSDVAGTSYYRWDRKAQKATFLFAARPELAKYTLAHRTPVIIPARDGLQLVSYLTVPTGAQGPVPMVLWVHGGPWGRDHAGWDPYAQFYASRGYAVLQVNFRGSTGFGKKFVNAGNGQWGKAMHDDLLDAVAWAIAQGVAPKDKIAIAGGSYGGYATLAGVTLTPDVFACGVDLFGPSNITTLLATVPPYWAPAIAMFKTRVGDWTTEAGKQALLAVSPVTHAGAIVRPLLIGQGMNDPRVKQDESDQIVKAMQAKSIPVTYVLFSDEGHGFHRPENNLAFMAVTEAFLSAHLGGSYQPMSKDDFAGSTIKLQAGKDGIPGLPAGM